MNKRTLKKRVYYIISDAVDHVWLDAQEANIEKKTNELLSLYDKTIEEINQSRHLKDKIKVKAYFANIRKQFNASIGQILS